MTRYIFKTPLYDYAFINHILFENMSIWICIQFSKIWPEQWKWTPKWKKWFHRWSVKLQVCQWFRWQRCKIAICVAVSPMIESWSCFLLYEVQYSTHEELSYLEVSVCNNHYNWEIASIVVRLRLGKYSASCLTRAKLGVSKTWQKKPEDYTYFHIIFFKSSHIKFNLIYNMPNYHHYSTIRNIPHQRTK